MYERGGGPRSGGGEAPAPKVLMLACGLRVAVQLRNMHFKARNPLCTLLHAWVHTCNVVACAKGGFGPPPQELKLACGLLRVAVQFRNTHFKCRASSTGFLLIHSL